ncbi:MAG: hypothetical protein IJ309_05070 [Clostridia bacterium]|nr:hypothetical protein [Clostridia bacterium]MBQ7907329.1 hypothetical protein [Clostridia bacterium]
MKKILMLVALVMALCLCACNTPLPPNDSESSQTETGVGGGLATDNDDADSIGNVVNVAYARNIEHEGFYKKLDLNIDGSDYVGEAFPEMVSYYKILDTYEKIREKIPSITQEQLNEINLSNNKFVIVREADTRLYGRVESGEYGFKGINLSKEGSTIDHYYQEVRFDGATEPVPEPDDFVYYWYFFIIKRSEFSEPHNIEGEIKIQAKSQVDIKNADGYNGYHVKSCELDLPNNTMIYVRGNQDIEKLNEKHPGLNIPLLTKDGSTRKYLLIYVENAVKNLPLYTFHSVSTTGNNLYISLEYSKEWETTDKSCLYYIAVPEMEGYESEDIVVHFIVTEVNTSLAKYKK